MLSARLAPTSKSLCNDSRAFVPLERAVVVARDSRLDGHMQDVGLHVPVKEPTSSGSPSAVGRYKRLGAYELCGQNGVLHTFPTSPPSKVSTRVHQSSEYSEHSAA
jgi:hypothetical protein